MGDPNELCYNLKANYLLEIEVNLTGLFEKYTSVNVFRLHQIQLFPSSHLIHNMFDLLLDNFIDSLGFFTLTKHKSNSLLNHKTDYLVVIHILLVS